VIDWFAWGYTTCGASGPVTSGIAGSGGAVRDVMPRSIDAIPGAATPVGGRRVSGSGTDRDGVCGDWQPAMMSPSARRWREVRMQERM